MEIKPYFSKNKVRYVNRSKEEEELDDIGLCEGGESKYYLINKMHSIQNK